MFEDLFKFKKAIFSKLEKCGFQKKGGVYRYSIFVLDKEFALEVIFQGSPFDTGG